MPCLGYKHIVLYSYATFTQPVKTGFDGEDHARDKLLPVAAHDLGRFVNVQAKAMTGLVTREGGKFRLFQNQLHRIVDIVSSDAGTCNLSAPGIGGMDCFIEFPVAVRHLAQEESSGDIRVIPAVAGAEIKQQGIAFAGGIIRARQGMWLGRIVASGDYRIEGQPIRSMGKQLSDKYRLDFFLGLPDPDLRQGRLERCFRYPDRGAQLFYL